MVSLERGPTLPRLARWFFLLSLVLLVLASPAQAQSDEAIFVMTFDGPVNPILVSYIERGIEQAEKHGATALILRLDTPGGQVDLTQDIVKTMRAANVPIIVYVWPTGAHAGSAGTFITLAGHAAAMTPGSSIGAASPIDGSGQDLGETIQKKLTNILSADVENLAKRRGEDAVTWARSAVEQAAAATAEEALALNVIDAIAADVDELIEKLDGFEVEVNGEPQTLHLVGTPVVDLPTTNLENILNTLLNAIIVPGIAIMLIVLGVQGIISEFSQPGGYFAGIVGAIALMLGLYALGVLNANWVGLGFIFLSFLLFFLDVKAPSHGALTVAGVITFVFGAALLFRGTNVEIPWPTIIGLAALTLFFFSFLVAKAFGAQRKTPSWGMESLVGQQGTTRTDLDPKGKVFLQGEYWDAELEVKSKMVPAGNPVTVVDRKGFVLIVRS
ncbi:MAG: nodulation protein NfeD [Chloroflexota bacterium]|nr:nodulation protein NfeD [Chloroflexota bacterium]